MQLLKSISNTCTTIHSYAFELRYADTYTVFLNTLATLKDVSITEIKIENSNDAIFDKRKTRIVELVFPMENINDLIEEYNADLLHVSLEYKNKIVEMIVNLRRYTVSIGITREDAALLQEFATVLTIAMQYAPRTGWWIKPTPYCDPICSICRKPPKHVFGEVFEYCPHCGAKNKRKEDLSNEI
jgi:hypothetical protein